MSIWTGHTRPELDLGAFIDLCRENGLQFIARPGPFIMSELKNEGLPFWLYDKHPEIVPVTWDGKTATTSTVDYLAPAFLQESRRWYGEVMKILKPRLHANGGNVIAMQLDNEIGMLSWVSNSPDLTDNVLEDFSQWLKRRYPADGLAKRYPFDLGKQSSRATAIRTPDEAYAGALMHDLGHYMRHRFARYIDTLRGFAEEGGARDLPFVVNIHGTSDQRGMTFPIGISQLYEGYAQDSQYLPATDIYLCGLSMDNFQDLYLLNAFTKATSRPGQTLACMEFEMGDGNYGQNFGNRVGPDSIDFKIRMHLAQGARLLNYYVTVGGTNYLLDPAPGDGNNRITTVGEDYAHGAPVMPDGRLNYMFNSLARLTKTIANLSFKAFRHGGGAGRCVHGIHPGLLHDGIALSGQRNHEQHIRQSGKEPRRPGGGMCWRRSMLLNGLRFDALNIQDEPLDVKKTPALVLASADYMSEHVQRKLANWMQAGGRLMLYGEVPQADMEGRPCTILAGSAGRSHDRAPLRQPSLPSVRRRHGLGRAQGGKANEPLQAVRHGRGGATHFGHRRHKRGLRIRNPCRPRAGDCHGDALCDRPVVLPAGIRTSRASRQD